MRNFKLILEYEGTAFHGWQTQTNGLRTVQEHLESKLQRIFKSKVHCQASGRTDSGVHALGQVTHFRVDSDIKPALIQTALNAFLDRDVSVISVEEVSSDFHAQRSAKEKTYCYTILNRPYPSALWRDRAYFYPQKVNLTLMRKAAGHLKGMHDFKAFQASSEAKQMKNTVRTIKALKIVKENDLIHVTITADGFLHKMVRNIVGTLLSLGAGQIAEDSIPRLLKSKDRKLLPKPAPGHGLCLVSVKY